MFQHTAARGRLRRLLDLVYGHPVVSTHSRPRAADRSWVITQDALDVSTHSRPRAADCPKGAKLASLYPFQHTAARGRLTRQ